MQMQAKVRVGGEGKPCNVLQVNPLLKKYEGISNNQTDTVVDNNKYTIEVVLKSNSYACLYDFPNAGESGTIYIAEDTDKTYRWSEEEHIYKCIGSDYNEIDIIDGGDSQTK